MAKINCFFILTEKIEVERLQLFSLFQIISWSVLYKKNKKKNYTSTNTIVQIKIIIDNNKVYL